MAQSNWNYNVRFSHRNEDAVKAWENLHSKEVNENFKSQNEFVVRAIAQSMTIMNAFRRK